MNELVEVSSSGDSLEIHQCAYAIVQASRQLELASLFGWLDMQAVVPEPFRAQPKLFPVLVDLKTLAVEQRKQLFAYAAAQELNADTPYFSALLDTSASAVEVTTHLARRMAVSRPGGEQDVLRFYDPFVFGHLRWILTPKQLDSLLGPIRCWNWREPNSAWRSYRREAASASLLPLLLKPDQWPTLMRLGDINATLRRLASVAPQLCRDDTLGRRIDLLLADASLTHRMEDRQDRLLYAEQAARFHPDIHSHPQLRRRLAMSQAEAISYTSACAGLDPSTLRDFSTELQSRYPINP